MTKSRYIPNTFNLLVVIGVALGSTACSYGMSVISSTIGQPSFYIDLGLAPQGESGYARTSQLIGAFNGVNSAGSAIAAAFTAWSANRIGRLRSIELGALVTVIGGALCAGSVNVSMFLVARFIAGWGVGTLITVSRLGVRNLTSGSYCTGNSDVSGRSQYSGNSGVHVQHARHHVCCWILSPELDRVWMLLCLRVRIKIIFPLAFPTRFPDGTCAPPSRLLPLAAFLSSLAHAGWAYG